MWMSWAAKKDEFLLCVTNSKVSSEEFLSDAHLLWDFASGPYSVPYLSAETPWSMIETLALPQNNLLAQSGNEVEL